VGRVLDRFSPSKCLTALECQGLRGVILRQAVSLLGDVKNQKLKSRTVWTSAKLKVMPMPQKRLHDVQVASAAAPTLEHWLRPWSSRHSSVQTTQQRMLPTLKRGNGKGASTPLW
jgi:hypothetical protein